MSIMVLGAAVGLFLLALALGGSKLARQSLLIIVVLFAAAFLAIWFFVYRD